MKWLPLFVIGILFAGCSPSASPTAAHSPRTWKEFVKWAETNKCSILGEYGRRLDPAKAITLSDVRVIGVVDSTISDLSPFVKLTELRGIMLDGTPVTDLSPLAKLKKLEGLFINRTKVTDLSPLRTLSKLSLLRVAGTPVSDEEIAKLQKALPECRIISVAWEPPTKGGVKPDEK